MLRPTAFRMFISHPLPSKKLRFSSLPNRHALTGDANYLYYTVLEVQLDSSQGSFALRVEIWF